MMKSKRKQLLFRIHRGEVKTLKICLQILLSRLFLARTPQIACEQSFMDSCYFKTSLQDRSLNAFSKCICHCLCVAPNALHRNITYELFFLDIGIHILFRFTPWNPNIFQLSLAFSFSLKLSRDGSIHPSDTDRSKHLDSKIR